MSAAQPRHRAPLSGAAPPRRTTSPCPRIEPRVASRTIRSASVGRPVALGAVLLVALATHGCGGLAEVERQSFESGVTALAESRWQSARDAFTRVLETRPQHGPSLLRRARAALSLGDPEAAIADLSSAMDAGLLEETDQVEAQRLLGEAHVAWGRVAIDDRAFRNREGSAELRREARDRFLQASNAFRAVLDVVPGDYDALHGRALSLYRQENHARALEVIEKQCEPSRPGFWRHRLLGALAWEGLNGPNHQSVRRALELTEGAPTAELQPVYIYLLDLADEVPDELRLTIEDRLARFVRVEGVDDPELKTFVARLEARRDAERRRGELDLAIRDARTLSDRGEFDAALETLARARSTLGDDVDLERLAAEIDERASVAGERAAERALADSRASPLEAIRLLERALERTREEGRAARLRDRILKVRHRVRREQMANEVREIDDLVRARAWPRVLERIQTIDPKELSPPEREFLLAARGRAHFATGDFEEALRSFDLLPRAKRVQHERIELARGVALLRLGRYQDAYSSLESLPVSDLDDEARRFVARQLLERGEPARAIAALDALESRLTEDRPLEASARESLAHEHFTAGRKQAALDEILKATAIRRENGALPARDHIALLLRCQRELGELDAARESAREFLVAGRAASLVEHQRAVLAALGEIELDANRPSEATSAWLELESLGGELPITARARYPRLLAVHGRFLPLDRVASWRYIVTGPKGPQPVEVEVSPEEGGVFTVTRRETGHSQEEAWIQRDGWLIARRGSATFRLPVGLPAEDAALPLEQFLDRDQSCTSELVAIDESVRLANGREFAHCLRVRSRREIPGADGSRLSECTVWLAPEVGEVRREIRVDEKLIGSSELEAIRLRERS